MNQPITLLSSSGGCAAKLGPKELNDILKSVRSSSDMPVFTSQYEDAGVFALSNKNLNLVQSIDVITPISDNPAIFGGIAVAHALNDLYAKGAIPITGLFFLGVPHAVVSPETSGKIIQGAIEKLHESGAEFLGGHTVESKQLEFGVSVTGITEKNIISNISCQEGDFLILTKPIGNGIISTALKMQNAGAKFEYLTNQMIEQSELSMLELNAEVSKAVVASGANACTDVSGFGLIGHLYEMIRFRKLSAIIDFSSIKILLGASDLSKDLVFSSGCEKNAAYWWDSCVFNKRLSTYDIMILFDPQTSGGLLISIPEKKINNLIYLLEAQKHTVFSIIGRVLSADNHLSIRIE